MPIRILYTLAALTALAGAGWAATGSHAAPAAFRGQNGRIVFNDQNGALNLVNADGTGLHRLRGLEYSWGYPSIAWQALR